MVLLGQVGLIADSLDDRDDVEHMLGFPTRSVKFNGGIRCPEIRWFLRLALESLDAHRNLPELNPLLPYANSKHAIPVKSDVYGAGILKAEEPHDS